MITSEAKLKKTIETYNNAAVRYQDKFMDMDLYHDTFDMFCNLIERKNATIFEIATGPGNITKYLTKKRPDFKILGIDLASNMIELAKINNPEAEFLVMDCRDINQIESKFDGIMCGFCIPYLSKEEVKCLISNSFTLLNSSGVIYISTMEMDTYSSGFETTSFSGNEEVYIYYHQFDYLSACLIETGFEIFETQRKKYLEPDGSYLTDLIIIAKKN